MATLELFLPVGAAELQQIAASGWRRLPSPSPGQAPAPLLLARDDAVRVAREWSGRATAAVFVTRCAVDAAFAARYPVQLGPNQRRELPVPAADRAAFHDHLVGAIAVTDEFSPAAVPPFTRMGREVLVDNPWHRYCKDRYTQRDGSEGVYYYIDMPGSCASIPVFDDGSTLLVRVHRYLLGADFWEFPIGGMKDGEDPLAVAQKELLEEAGVTARRWTAIGRFAPYKGVSNEICHFYLAQEIEQRHQELEPSEQISVHRMSLAEARRRLVDQDCSDGQSLAGLVLLDRWLGQGNRL